MARRSFSSLLSSAHVRSSSRTRAPVPNDDRLWADKIADCFAYSCQIHRRTFKLPRLDTGETLIQITSERQRCSTGFMTYMMAFVCRTSSSRTIAPDSSRTVTRPSEMPAVVSVQSQRALYKQSATHESSRNQCRRHRASQHCPCPWLSVARQLRPLSGTPLDDSARHHHRSR